MKKRALQCLLAVLVVSMLASCAPAQTQQVDNSQQLPSESSTSTSSVTPEPTPEPTPTPRPTEDYGRDRTGEYVYLANEKYHEPNCQFLYGDMEGMLFEDAIGQGIEAASCCIKEGKLIACDFPLNEGFDRTMKIQRKIQIISEGGKSTQDVVFVTTGDANYDLNMNFVNYACRFFYKEFYLDPSEIRVHIRNNSREYHNTQCEKVINVSTKYYLHLSEVYEEGMTACKSCLPPTKQYVTMPKVAADDAHYYYVTPAFIRRVLSGREVDPKYLVDMERIDAGYYDE